MHKFTWFDVLEASANIILATAGWILFAEALSYGMAGPIQAIDNVKIIVQALMAAIFLGQIPSLA